ncbi:uncharacterized protein [Nicotiana sylvestris]|uniref:uncharacterized protein n=1 Tax=Nicotiana sylvestris TaxID=4096 RepID=UPI00388C4D05
MGGIVEEGLKSNKIMSYSVIMATTQAIQNGAGGLIGKKKREDVATIDSLKKTPAQISLLSLLIHSDEHRRALMKILNEAHVLDKISVNHLEKIANKIFEVNRVTFSDDELPVEEFTMEFQVLDVAVSYNLLLGRPWIHAAKAVPSTLHQMVKFEWDRQEIVVHGEDNLCAHSDSIVPFIEIEDDKGPWVYQVFETVSVEKISEWKCVPTPKVTAASVMVAFEMLKNSFVPAADVQRVRKFKQRAWALPKPIPCLSRSFVKPGARKCLVTIVSNSVVDIDEELIERFQRLFDDVNMVEVGEGSSKADVQFVGPNAKLNNWKATPFPTRKEFWEEIIKALFEYKDIFAWSYDDMPGLSTDLMVHKLPTDPTFPPVKQKLRKFKTDMSVKIKEEVTKQFDAKTLRRYNLKLNLAKYAFGVPFGKLLGFIVSHRGIELDPSKIKSIQELPPPRNKTELMSLLGRLNFISGFIAHLTTTWFRHIPRIDNEVSDALATLASMLHHPDKAYVDPLHIQVRDQHAYCNMVEEELDGEPWCHYIREYIKMGVYPVQATGDQKRTIRCLASGFFLSGGVLYKRTPDHGLLRCINARQASTIMTETVSLPPQSLDCFEAVYGLHINMKK